MHKRGRAWTLDASALRKLYASGVGLTDDQWALITLDKGWGADPEPRTIIEIHDLLLFVKAFPLKAEDRRRAEVGLTSVSERASELAGSRAGYAKILFDSGIAGTAMRARFSIDMCRWMLEVEPGAVSIDGLEGDESRVRELLLSLVLPAERDAADDERHDVLSRIKDLSAGGPLRWMIGAIEMRTPDPLLRHALWENCGIALSVRPGRSVLARTWCEGVVGPLHAWPEGLKGKVDVRGIMEAPLSNDGRLDARHRRPWLDAARGVLVGCQRETDPVTLCDPAAVRYHPMGEGIGVALFTLPPSRRAAYDPYVGYVAFSNAVPVAYGGAWLFPGKSKVGINIFPAFRGGPSQLLFAQILRCYAQRYGTGCFEAENYQLGCGNADGIRSGAYWFYHRMGFRTTVPRLADIAEQEAGRMRADPAHRTDSAVLRKLAAEPMRLEMHREDAPMFEPLDLSERVLHHLAGISRGDRHQALRIVSRRVARALGVSRNMRSWPDRDRAGFVDLAPAIDLIPDLEKWPPGEKRLLVSLMRSKARLTEDQYIASLRRHKRLLKAWCMLADQA